MNYTKSLTALVLGSIVAFTTFASAASAFEVLSPKTESGNVVVETTDVVHDTVFGTGQDVDVRGTIEHDAFLAGKTVAVHQRIGNNLFAAGETVHVSGQVNGDVFAAGQRVVIDRDAVITGDVAVAGETLEIDGDITGKLHAYGTTITLMGRVGKETVVGADKLILDSGATLLGDLTGSVSQPLVQASGATVQGQTNLEQSKTPMQENPRLFGFSAVAGILIAIILTLVGGVLTTMIAPGMTDRVRTQMQKEPIRAGLIGFATVLVSIPLFLLLLSLIVTIPVAFFEISVLATTMLLGHVFSSLWLGDVIGMALGKKYWPVLGAIAAGTFVLVVLKLVPFLGALCGFVVMTVGVGAVLNDVWHHYLQPKK